MSFPFETNPCEHDPLVLHDFAYASARSSREGSEAVMAEAAEVLCSDCCREIGRVSRILRALTELARIDVPSSLDGRVVAATQAGYRQDRAVRALRDLTRASAPQELGLRLRADDLLSELSPEQMAAGFEDLEDGIDVGRSGSESPALAAPPELDERVAFDLARNRTSAGGGDSAKVSLRNDLARSRGLAFGALVGAAALLLLVQLRLQGTNEDPSSASHLARAQAPRLEDENLELMTAELGLTFSVRRLSSEDELRPEARKLFQSLAGPRVARGEAQAREDKPAEEKGF